VLGLATTSLILYPVGTLLFSAAMLYKARRAISSRRESVLSEGVKFLWCATVARTRHLSTTAVLTTAVLTSRSSRIDFEKWAFWWELLEMTRRLVLVGIMVLVYRGSMYQLVIGSTC
jgi:hypothetical protein